MSEENPLSQHEVQELIDTLYNAAERYYHDTGNQSPMTDEQFDAGIELLRSVAESGEVDTFFAVGTRGYQLLEGSPSLGTAPQSANVVEHKHPMLSLQKAKTEESLVKYLDKAAEHGIETFKLQAKLDGLAMAAVYHDGKLVQLARRGDGHRGDDTTFALHDPNLTILGLPESVDTPGRFEVRGELLFTFEHFAQADAAREEVTGERFKNARNAASGVLMRSESGLSYPATLSFVVFSAIHNESFISMEGLSEDFTTADSVTAVLLDSSQHLSKDQVFEAIQAFGAARDQSPYPTDGVVVKPQEEMRHYATMGFTAHSPGSQIAWKYAAEQSQTVIREVSVTVGKTGRLTPVAHVEPVVLDGSTVERASLHNYNLVYEKDIRVGSIVSIEKANDIIPQIVHVIQQTDGSERILPPSTCPVCGSELETLDAQGIPLKSVLCENMECTSRVLFVLNNAASKSRLDFDRLSEVSIEYLHSEGILKTVADFYMLTADVLADSRLGFSAQGTPRRMGESTAAHVMRHIEASKTAPFDRLLASLGIPGVGVRLSRVLQEHFDTFDTLRAATVEELSSIDGIGVITAERIRDGLARNAEVIDAMRAAGVDFEIPSRAEVPSDSPVAGLSVAISGKVPEGFANRQDFVAWLEDHGAVFHSSPKKDTDIVVADPEGTSSKIKKAHSWGLRILLPEEFAEQFGIG